MVDKEHGMIFLGIGVGVLVLALLFIPISQSAPSHATDVSNDQPPLFISTGGTNSSTNNNSNIPCNYMVFKDGASNIDAKNCSTGKLDFITTDASTTIQDAINAMNTGLTNGGGRLYIATGTYIINHPINLTDSITIEGSSPTTDFQNIGTRLFEGNNCNCNVFQYKGSTAIFFVLLKFFFVQGNFANNVKGNGTFLNGNTNEVILENMYFDGFAQYGISIDTASGNRIMTDAIENNKLGSLLVKSGNDISIMNNKFIMYGVTKYKTNAILGCSKSLDSLCGVVKNARVNSNYITSGNVTTYNFNGVISGNTIFGVNTNQAGLLIQGNSSGTVVSDNLFNGTGTGAYAIQLNNSTTSNVLIENNRFVSWLQPIPVSDSGTNTIIRNNAPTVVNNDLVAGTGISITQGVKSNTISNTGIISLSCSNGITCSGSNPATITPSWQLLCQTVLGSANATINCDNFIAMKNLYVQVYAISNGGTGVSPAIRFNGDSSAIYAYRINSNGGVDSTQVSMSQCGFNGTAPPLDTPYITLTIDNQLSNKDKMAWFEEVTGADTGGGTAPSRDEGVCKWGNGTAQVTTIWIIANSGTGNFNTNSELTVWGYN